MDIYKNIKQTAKALEKISDDTLKLMEGLTDEIVNFENIDQYEEFQVLVKEGYLTKSYRTYGLSDLGKELLEAKKLKDNDVKKFEKLTEEDDGKEKVSVTFKKHDLKENVIANEVASFEIEKDGIPVIVVNEETYANLLHRVKGQHWKQYLGEEGRQLIRQKKLSRFYVEDENTKRRYLYIVP